MGKLSFNCPSGVLSFSSSRRAHLPLLLCTSPPMLSSSLGHHMLSFHQPSFQVVVPVSYQFTYVVSELPFEGPNFFHPVQQANVSILRIYEDIRIWDLLIPNLVHATISTASSLHMTRLFECISCQRFLNRVFTCVWNS